METLTAYDNYDKYFAYKGATYTCKTKVKISQKYIDTHLYNGMKIWKHAWFSNSIIENEKKYYVFWIYKLGTFAETKECSGHFLLSDDDLDEAIEEIVYAVPISIVPRVKKRDSQVPEVILGWACFIFILIFSFIFKQWYLIWFWGTIYFLVWRNKMLWE